MPVRQKKKKKKHKELFVLEPSEERISREECSFLMHSTLQKLKSANRFSKTELTGDLNK